MNIRLLETELEREAMYRMVHDEYVKAGYIDQQPDGRFVHYDGLFDRIPQTDIFLAYDDTGDLVGTNSLTRDNDIGIHTAIDFPKETMRERLTDRNLASSWRIVTKADCRSGGGVVSALIKATVQRADNLGVETCLFTFNPRHMCRYHIALNMEMIGFAEHVEGLHNAPAVLMRVYTREIPARWFSRNGKREAA